LTHIKGWLAWPQPPALQAFYATLSGEQKLRLDTNYGRGRFGRWRTRAVSVGSMPLTSRNGRR
jgi:hypothetical protein